MDISRRALLAGLLLPLAARAQPGPATLGAIRWDAWDVPGSVPTEAMVRSLSPPAWRHRAPFFAEVPEDGAPIRLPPPSAATMARQNAAARAAGIDYWAFLAYPRGSSMRVGFELYRAGPQAPRFCFIAEAFRWAEVSGDHPALMAEPAYQRVAGGRPLYFLAFLSDDLIVERWGGIEGLRAEIAAFRARVRAAGAGDPYLVLMTPVPDQARRWVRLVGADAVSAYALYPGARNAPYAALASHAEREWRRLAAVAPTIPTAMSGWDRRPRIQNPVPWEGWQAPGQGADRFHAAPTPGALAAHIARALAFAATQEPRTALVYAWNEHDEGGWLQPTHPYDDSRLRALRARLCAPVPRDTCVRTAP
jgi:hypothetical protein